jgi:hypothetical protein
MGKQQGARGSDGEEGGRNEIDGARAVRGVPRGTFVLDAELPLEVPRHRLAAMPFVYPKRYDVIVIGAGHAGVEAALAAARMGCSTLMLSINLDTIGQMSCNPAIGGLAKGHLAREIDALGGEMGRNTDMTGLQFRMLNTKKGPSVWAPRAQCDKKAYQFRLKWICERQPNLDLQQGQTVKLLVEGGVVRGVETTLEVQYLATTVVITTGTFLRGQSTIRWPSGRVRSPELVGILEGGRTGVGALEDRHPAPFAASIHRLLAMRDSGGRRAGALDELLEEGALGRRWIEG